ncbi:MAG: head-tail connector protein [Pseudomonadota bacterium]
MSLTMIAPPAGEPVSLAEMKEHLRVTHADEDALIAAYAGAARQAVEARAGLGLMTQAWRWTLDAAPAETIVFPLSPVASVDAVRLRDEDGGETLVDPERYAVSPGAPGRLRATAPWTSLSSVDTPPLAGVEIDFTIGWPDAESVPASLSQAVRLLTADYFDHRDVAASGLTRRLPETVDALIAPYRQVRL